MTSRKRYSTSCYNERPFALAKRVKMSGLLKRTITGLMTVFAVYACQSNVLHAQYAQSFLATLGQKFTIELDSADGHQSEWLKYDLGSLSALRASCVIRRLGKNESGSDFSFKISFAKSPIQKSTGYGLVLKTISGQPPIALETGYWDIQARKQVALKQFSKTIGIDENFIVELIWTDRKLRVAVGNSESTEVAIPERVNGVYITSSTGDLRCNVVLGTAK